MSLKTIKVTLKKRMVWDYASERSWGERRLVVARRQEILYVRVRALETQERFLGG